jgi:1-deoxyxylulose-5-phosphate synthase
VEFRRLGDSDLNVSEICLGSWLTYGAGVGREQTEACTRAALEAGINFFDTANMYGRGAAEETWGQVLGNHPRSSYVLATKVGHPMMSKKRPWTWRDQGLGRRQVHKQIDGSLKRLRTDHVDLYQCHTFDENTPLEETMEALTEVVKAGKARYIGFSGWPVQAIRAAMEMPGVARFVSCQAQYSMLQRMPEAELMPLCRANGISQLVFSPLAQGVLTGKYRPGERPPADSRAASQEMGAFMELDDRVLEAVGRVRSIADDAGLTMARLALAWILRRDDVAATIIGATRPEQVHENAAASGVKLDDDTLRAIDEALGCAVAT